MNNLEETCTALEIIFARLDTLASITASSILIPGGPQARYHEIVEEAGSTYPAGGLAPTARGAVRSGAPGGL